MNIYYLMKNNESKNKIIIKILKQKNKFNFLIKTMYIYFYLLYEFILK